MNNKEDKGDQDMVILSRMKQTWSSETNTYAIYSFMLENVYSIPVADTNHGCDKSNLDVETEAFWK